MSYEDKHLRLTMCCLAMAQSMGFSYKEARAVFMTVAEMMEQIEKTPDAADTELSQLAKAIFLSKMNQA